MLEIKLSYIYNFEYDDQALAELVGEFGAQHGVKVHLQRMTWSTAWADLFTIASQDGGPDVSHIGSTWVSSLTKLNVLRAFKPSEIAEIGDPMPFMPATWQTTRMLEDERILSIPWTGWIYVVCYRKDLLKEAGIDVSKAFGTVQALSGTIAALQNSSLEIPWLNASISQPYTDLLHIAASWIWAAGGDFIDSSNTKVTFDSPRAIEGLIGWLDSYRAVPKEYRHLSQQETFELFVEGRAAAFLSDVHRANELLDKGNAKFTQENYGVATLTDVPWTGAGNFVIWNHTRGHFERERAAVELVKFLTNKAANLRWMQETGWMPARVDALKEIYPAGNPLHDAVMLAVEKGRAYKNIHIWRPIEYRLSMELAAVLNEVNENPSANSGDILRAHMQPLARRLNITLFT